MSAFAPELMVRLFGSDYASGADVLRLVAWSPPLHSIVTGLEIPLLATGGETGRATVFGAAVAVFVGVALPAIPRCGARGAATGFGWSSRKTVRAAWVTGVPAKILAANLPVGILALAARRALAFGPGRGLHRGAPR